MFTLEGVKTAGNSSDATTRYWLMRAGAGLSTEQLAFEAGLWDGTPRTKLAPPSLAYAVLLDRARQHSGVGEREAHLAAARLSVAQVIYVDCTLDILRDPDEVPLDGVNYRTDYRPVGRLADATEGQEQRVIGSLPIRTSTTTFPEFAYAKEEGQPFTVIYGDLDVVQAHLVETRGVSPGEVVALS